MTIPFNLQDPAFLTKWDSWMAFRKRFAKVGNWDAMFDEQLSFLARYAVPEAIEILSQSIRNGWRGLFEVKGAPSGHGEFKKAGTVWESKVCMEAVEARLRTIKGSPDSYEYTLHPESKAFADHLAATKPGGWEERVKAVKASLLNHVKVMKPALKEEYNNLLMEKSRLEQLTRGQQ